MLKWLIAAVVVLYAGFVGLLYVAQRSLQYFPERRRTALNEEPRIMTSLEGVLSAPKAKPAEKAVVAGKVVVAFVTEVRPRDKMIVGIMGVMEVDVVAKQLTANWMVGDLIM
jgi:hypothetical protein